MASWRRLGPGSLFPSLFSASVVGVMPANSKSKSRPSGTSLLGRVGTGFLCCSAWELPWHRNPCWCKRRIHQGSTAKTCRKRHSPGWRALRGDRPRTQVSQAPRLAPATAVGSLAQGQPQRGPLSIKFRNYRSVSREFSTSEQ